MSKIVGYPTEKTKLFTLLGVDISIAWAKGWYRITRDSKLVEHLFFFRDITQEAGVITYRFILWRVKVEIKFLVQGDTFYIGAVA